MNKIFTIIRREYLTRVKTKGFIIGTIAMPVFVLGISIVPALLSVIRSEDQKHFAVIDMTGQVFNSLQNALDDKMASGERIYDLTKRNVSEQDLDMVKQELRGEIDDGKLQGFLLIPSSVFENNEVEFYSKNVSNFRQNSELENAVSRIVQERRIAESGLEPDEVKKLTQHVDLKTIRVGRGGEETEDQGGTFIIAYILVLFLYMALIFYGTFVMRSVIEEKTSRVVEMLVSSVSPFQLMAGKILGVGSVGLTQFLIWALTAAGISAYSASLIGMFSGKASAEFSVPTIGLDVLVYFVLFFVFGYLLFATLYAALGAMVNSEQEAQHMQFPVLMFLIVPMMMMGFIIGNPNTTSSVVMSMIPFFSPIIMFTRIVVEMPPFSEIVFSIVLLLVTIYLMILLAGKIFRVGILMYGKRPTLPEIVRWIRYS